ncbi:MAG: MotA/TolQ/ExbB proton channel family protein [Terracidiphilus sp.]
MQADSGAAPPAPEQASSAIVEMVMNSGLVAQIVLAILLFASLYSWTVILGKSGSLRRATSASRRFVQGFRQASRLQEIAVLAEECKASPFAQVFEDVYETYKRQTGGSGPPRNIAPLERSAQTAASGALTSLERQMTWLATIASISVYVGLFGTVMGILDAFHGLGTAGAATLRAVAPGISAALVTTAAGLFVAVPANIAYNQFTARIRDFASKIDGFCRELLNSLEEIPVRAVIVPRPIPGGAEAQRNETGRPEARPEAAREADRGLFK